MMTKIDQEYSKIQRRSERVDSLDVARGVGIFLVVFGHVERGLVSAGVAEGHWWAVLDRAIYSFHMPLFILLAGMNVPLSLARNRRTFLETKVRTIAYPYFLWSFMHGAIMVIASQVTNSEIGLGDLLQIGWKPIAPFWFLYALFVFMLLAWVARGRLLVLWILAALGLAYAQYDTSESLLHQISYNLIFFAVGVTFSQRLYALHFKWLAGPFLAIFWVLAFQLVPGEGKAPYLKPAAVLAGFAGIFVVIAIAQRLRGAAFRHLALLGRLSMTIYVLHVMVASAARIAMVKIVGLDDPLILLSACTLTGVYVPLLVHFVLKSLNLLAPLGLGKRRQQAVRS